MTSKGSPDAAASLLLGRAWMERGQDEAAERHLRHALDLQTDHPEAHRYLAYLRVRRGAFKEGWEHLQLAARAKPTDLALQREVALLRELAGCAAEPVALPDQPGGRLRIPSLYERRHHRSGWRYAMQALHGLHHSAGVRFEGFLEDPFAWQHPRAGIRKAPELLAALRAHDFETRLTSEERHIIPIREPWVGFLHNPPNMPAWFHPEESPQAILAKPVWQESVRHCVGLFTLSEYAADWLRRATGLPVSAVPHPTETPTLCFDFERFLANPDRHVVQVGWWLRRLTSIDRLPLPHNNSLGLSKLRLLPDFAPGSIAYLRTLLEQESQRDGIPDAADAAQTREAIHIPDADYDRLLSENLVFVDLYDASANNAVIECLARATPILVNRLPAVEEYLGRDYPLFYDDLRQAAAMAQDLERLRAAHLHLLHCPRRTHLDGAAFRQAVETSEVYRLL